MRALDWARILVGPVEHWPQSLKTAVRIVLGSRYPMFVWWGRELTKFYNDAYIPVLGKRHPQALAQPASLVWAEIWCILGPQAETLLNEGRVSWDKELLLIMERNGYSEETYFTYSYSPVVDAHGGAGGVFCACREDTGRVLGRRRLRTLRELAASTAQAKNAEEACQLAARSMGENPHDMPFALLCLLDAGGAWARLVGTAGLDAGAPSAPQRIDIMQENNAGWPLHRVMTSGKTALVKDLPDRFGVLPGGPWPDPSQRAMVLPLAQAGQERLAGFLIAGLSPRLAFDDDYRGFLGLLTGQVVTAISNARAYEAECQRAEALAELDQAKTVFFSNVSHEFRTPLTLLLGPVENMLGEAESTLAPRDREQLVVVHRAALRLQKLVNTLLISRASKPAASRLATSRPTWPHTQRSWPESFARQSRRRV
jgi:His Kinase A (phospho-acceptor) domain/GAF domain